jgi:hypothetical protein
MKVDVQKLHTHYMELSAYYARESESFARENNINEAKFWDGKAFAIQYAAFLLEEELHNND